MNPLNQLADITPPDAVSLWPLAWGYWVLIIVLLLVLVSTAVLWRKYRQHVSVQQYSLNSIQALDDGDVYFSHKVQVLLKRFFAHYYPEYKIESLSASELENEVINIYTANAASDEQSVQIRKMLKQLFIDMYADATKQANCENTIKAEAVKSIVKHLIKQSTPAFLRQKKKAPRGINKTSEAAHV